MNKEELIKAMREAMLGISKAKFAGWRKIAERQSDPDAVPRIDREVVKWVEKQEPQIQACAEAALTIMSGEWVRVEDVPLTESGWIEFITKNGMNNGYYDDEFPNTVWSEKGSTRAKARVSSIIVYRKIEPPKE